MVSSNLEFCGIITIDYRIVEVNVSKAALRDPGSDEAVFSCRVMEGSVTIVFSTTTGSKFVLPKLDHYSAVRAYIKKVEEAQQLPGFFISKLLNVEV